MDAGTVAGFLMFVAIGVIVAGVGLVLAANFRGRTDALAARYERLTGVRSAIFVLPLRLMGAVLVMFGLLFAVLALNNL
jgi:hypothetical protein